MRPTSPDGLLHHPELGDCHWIRSERKTLALHVMPDGRVVLRTPRRTGREEAWAFLSRHAAWARRHRARISSVDESQAVPAPSLEDGSILQLEGTPHPVRYALEPRRTADVRVDQAGIVVRGRDAAACHRALERFLEARTLERARALVPPLSARIGRTPSGIRTRRSVRRYGACSRAGIITLHPLAATLPDDLFAYLLCHEMCHLRHFGHTPAFRSLLLSIRPGARAERSALFLHRLREHDKIGENRPPSSSQEEQSP